MQVADFIQSRNIRHLYHFTDERNLPLIRQHGLLPYTELVLRGIAPPKPGGNEWSRDADSIKGVDAYVHLCLLDQHPMEYVARRDGHLGATRFLRISTEVLSFPGVMGCSDVSNKTGVVIHSIDQALDIIDSEILFGGLDFSKKAIEACGQDEACKTAIIALRNRFNEAKKSEVLIPSPIPPDLISNLG